MYQKYYIYIRAACLHYTVDQILVILINYQMDTQNHQHKNAIKAAVGLVPVISLTLEGC